MKITIKRGDEHRAKIETNFTRDDFFADVYTRADILVGEITQELQAYKKERKANASNFFAYHGMTNNIIIFCGERGQGKTSAMQSFARYLGKPCAGERAEKDPDALVLNKKGDHVYEVIESIDPSAMENEESVLRVLISRLFFRLEQGINKASGKAEVDLDFAQKRKKIVELFQACYTNIDYIKSGRITNYEQDDLDALSQLGSSAKLKANLHDLIETYLDMMMDREDGGEHKERYLVIPIDDADLATKKVFQICEDIRNYLSIPNVIILMAADYGQLVQATFQRYLKQYQFMWKAEKYSGHKLQVVDECHEMAAKYLEKVFPVSHRIELPRIDRILMEGHTNVTFRYMVSMDGKMESAFDGCYSKTHTNLQDQLLELLYKRTGLVFVEKNRKMHLFLPNTLRELAHWVKMLYEMRAIECDKVYQSYQKSEQAEVDQLKENILKIKQYFMNYWCEKNLDISAVRTLQKIDSATKREQMAEVKDALCDYYQNGQELTRTMKATEATYQEVIHNIVEKWFDGKSYFQEAVYIYYTIFLNEWFAAALEDHSQFEAIVSFVEHAVYLADYKKVRSRSGYDIMQFKVDVKLLCRLLDHSMEQSAYKCLKSFCVAVKNNKIVENIHIFDVINQKAHLNSEIDALEFNVFRPFLSLLKESTDEVIESDEADTQTKEGVGKEGDSTRDGSMQECVQRVRMPYLITIRNFIANYDAQLQVRNAISSWYESAIEESESIPFNEQISKLYKVIEQGVRMPDSVTDKGIEKIYHDTCADDNDLILKELYLCNRANRSSYLLYMKSALEDLAEEITGEWDGFDFSNDLHEYPDDEIQKLYEKSGDLLKRIEEETRQNLTEWEKLADFGKALSSSASNEWNIIDKMYQCVNNKEEQLQGLRKKIDERKKAALLAEQKNIAPSDENHGEQQYVLAETDHDEFASDKTDRNEEQN